MKTGQQVHPRTIITFGQEVLSGITQYYRTVVNIWDSLYLKHQLRESNLTLDRVYAMLAEFLIELRLHEEQDEITQIVTGSSSSVKHSMYDEYINASKGKVPAKAKAKASNAKAKVNSLSGDQHAMTIGSQAVAHKAITVQSIIQDDNQVDVQYAVLPNMPLHSVLVQSNLRPKMPNGMSRLAIGMNLNGKMINGRLRSMRRPKVRKIREKDLSPRANLKGRLRRGLSLQSRHSLHRRRMTDPNPTQT